MNNLTPRLLGAALLALLTACAPTTPQWEGRFGESVRATMASQVARPQVAANANPVTGIDGRAARTAQERYEAGQKPAETQAAPLVGVR